MAELMELVGDHVEYQACRARQHLTSGAHPFHHLKDCPLATRFSERPWRQFVEVLKSDAP